MISYMVDGQGYLIISREVVSEDVEVCICARKGREGEREIQRGREGERERRRERD